MCLVLGISFYVVSAAVKDKVKRGLKASIVHTEEKVSKASFEFNRRASRMIAALSENAGLKAGMDLVHQIPHDDPMRAEALQTVEDQLNELGLAVECDFLALRDRQQSFEQVAVLDGAGSFALSGMGAPEHHELDLADQ